MAQAKGVSISNTGMDMDALVKASVTTYQSKYDAAYKKETVAEWTKSAYADLYTELFKFQTGTASDYKLQSKTTAHAVTSSDSSTVTAIANGDAINMSHSVIVNTVAQNANLQSTAAITRAITSDSSSGTAVDTSKSTKLSYIAGISTADTTATANLDTVAISFNIADSTSSTATNTVSYTYKDLQTKTLNDLASDIKKLNTNITANYDATNDVMNIYNKEAGTSNIIKITANTDSTNETTYTNQLLTNLNLGSYDSSTQTTTAATTTSLAAGTIAGVASAITVDGHSYSGDSNEITVAGVTYTANKVSASTTTSGTTTYTSTTVGVSTDSDTLVKSVQAFVDNYNTLLDKMTAQLHATKSSSYGALTVDQKSAMTADQITAWETKAKTGILRNDTMISKTVDDLRNSLAMPVTSLNGNYVTAASIGLNVGDWTTYGHITLDTDKLKTAIAADPDVVNKIFASDNTNTSTTDTGSQGVATRLSNLLAVDLKNISAEAGISASTSDTSVLGKQITDMNTNLTALLKVLQAKEDYYYKKYNDMESAVGKLTSSLTSVTSYLGS
jgi:flagellar hook-associated protein 2